MQGEPSDSASLRGARASEARALVFLGAAQRPMMVRNPQNHHWQTLRANMHVLLSAAFGGLLIAVCLRLNGALWYRPACCTLCCSLYSHSPTRVGQGLQDFDGVTTWVLVFDAIASKTVLVGKSRSAKYQVQLMLVSCSK